MFAYSAFDFFTPPVLPIHVSDETTEPIIELRDTLRISSLIFFKSNSIRS
ncbi:MAG: hypothetical protein BAJATHORv1_30442 [Candidatus Thorarchaeota archaeon]|nr:MAG: hypothetical protein BAJATHORv1_30442 [Candidatus Thorarchaeota archaeon]